ncbi:L-threonylcarbamoyladenylate synthase [Sporosarcina pasteurii]|uniref:Threonylcarbamoyl-AMP synthase n=1 Tax=Sporosarcina pasteurii TaxID=1474 RepID=A0A380BDE3_SPOPA|nr:L-threonylcarbamoyladenylate synthase [Sporosarcina pasteurii]MDS9472284.1 L-threonylcarbamoyladenylate synthase [Sporosarcina pasteurii]QBQ06265.1 threonylcarbamoyl-AMP synthase [Sporosarcina pasteurii]SUI99094.1 t(6)A37 threonylcarbamoyladenosine biosynthesis protein RimN [Sporosarcina pasteurii]
MKTIVTIVDNSMDNEREYQQAVDMLSAGEVVAFPTETVYGLGAVATNEKAVEKIFQAKGRPSDNPLIVHIGTQGEVAHYAKSISLEAKQLMKAFWPGPLTLVFEQIPHIVAPNVTPGVTTVGIRMPDHPVALRLLQTLKLPLAAPSANRSGKPSPTEALHVKKDLNGRIPLILDGGQTGVGLESTVIDMTSTPPVILRPGGITKDMIEAVIGPVETAHGLKTAEAPRSPGMKYAHYAPEAPLFIIEANQEKIKEAVTAIQKEGQKVAVIGPNDLNMTAADWYFAIGANTNVEEMAANLYKALRQCDTTEADLILAVETNLEGVGEAFMNRLLKAADGRRYDV